MEEGLLTASDGWGGMAADTPDLATLAGAVVGVLLLFYLGAWLTAKLLKVAPTKGDEQFTLRCVSSLRLAGKTTIHVVRAGGRALLLGNGERGVTLLAELDDADAQSLLEAERDDETQATPTGLEAGALEEEPAPPPHSAPLVGVEAPAARRPDGRRSMPSLRFLAGPLLLLAMALPAQAQSEAATGPASPARPAAPETATAGADPAADSEGAASADAGEDAPEASDDAEEGTLQVQIRSAGKDGFSSALKVAMGLTLLMFVPALLTSVTAFTRVVIVLSFARRAVGSGTLPPNQVVVGLALFLTVFVMAPVGKAIHATAYEPYQAGELTELEALEVASGHVKAFMLHNTRPKDLALFIDLSGTGRPASPAAVPFWVAAPSFMISELRTAFLMAFAIYLPFLVIDLVVASGLLSVGLIMVPPPLISAPLKILLFVLADGWYLLARGLVLSFGHAT